MRIRYQRSGGLAYLPGLQRPVDIDVDALPASAQAHWHQLVTQARFFDLPAQVGAQPKGSADQTLDQLTIEHDGRSHAVKVLPAAGDESLKTLLQAVRDEVKRGRSQGSA